MTLAAFLGFAWLFINFVEEPRFRPPHFFPGGPDHPPPGFWPAPPQHRPEDKVEEKPQVDDSILKVDWNARAELVKGAFLHAYHGYEEYAVPKDELLPLTNKSVNKCVVAFITYMMHILSSLMSSFNGWGVTLVDALDTMYLMGLDEEFERGIDFVENMTFTAGKVRCISHRARVCWYTATVS